MVVYSPLVSSTRCCDNFCSYLLFSTNLWLLPLRICFFGADPLRFLFYVGCQPLLSGPLLLPLIVVLCLGESMFFSKKIEIHFLLKGGCVLAEPCDTGTARYILGVIKNSCLLIDCYTYRRKLKAATVN